MSHKQTSHNSIRVMALARTRQTIAPKTVRVKQTLPTFRHERTASTQLVEAVQCLGSAYRIATGKNTLENPTGVCCRLSVLFTSVSVPVEPGEPLYLIAYRKLDA